MNQIKIGKFIAQKRKEQGLTQMQLAEIHQRKYGNAHWQDTIYEMPQVRKTVLAKEGYKQGIILIQNTISLNGVRQK